MRDSGLPADVLVGKFNKDISFALRRGTIAQVTTHHALDGCACPARARPPRMRSSLPATDGQNCGLGSLISLLCKVSRQGRPPIIMTGDNRSSRRLDGGYAPTPKSCCRAGRAAHQGDASCCQAARAAHQGDAS